MEAKDVLTAVGVLVTLLLGCWNFFENRVAAKRMRFINTVTNQRVIWIEQLRQDLATYIGLAGSMAHEGDGGADVQRKERNELNRLRNVIALRLNPGSPIDQEIAELLDRIFKSAYAHEVSFQVGRDLDELTNKSQALIKAEWEKVKDEAVSGRLKTQADRP